ncbi:MAG TPA: TIGR03086 family metal-binding protein [Acidimicrobiia bacterium]|nr:TIGR03086 family metal-binding protein [Acidimicrobiia bacterium]
MTASLADHHDRALTYVRTIIHGIDSEQWDWPTPCDDWTVRELVNHVVTGNYWASELMAGKTIEEVGDRLDGDILGIDPLAKYEDSAKLADHAFQEPGAMEKMAAVSYGPVPGEVYCGHRFVDTLVHGWDLAKATGQNTDLDPGLVDACLAVIEPQLEMLQGSGAFGDETIDVAADADPQTRLLAWTGRRA